jgi:hypothetical protein
MRRALAAAAIGALASCAPVGQVTTTVAATQQACVMVRPWLDAALVVPDPRVQVIVSYGNAVCGPLAVGSVPATVDANTPAWLGELGGMLKVLAPIALMLL